MKSTLGTTHVENLRSFSWQCANLILHFRNGLATDGAPAVVGAQEITAFVKNGRTRCR